MICVQKDTLINKRYCQQGACKFPPTTQNYRYTKVAGTEQSNTSFPHFPPPLRSSIQIIKFAPKMTQTIILITGANRGIGLVSLYLLKPHHTIIAAVRSPSSATPLFFLPHHPTFTILTITIDASVSTSASTALKKLEHDHPEITHLDVVIANAGISSVWPTVEKLDVEDLRSHMEINVYGVVWLFQATLRLLRKGREPRWVTVGSTAGWTEVC